MKASNLDRLRIQSSLYPWILLSLLREQLEPSAEWLEIGKGLPTKGAFSLSRDTGTAVVWDRARADVSFVPLTELDAGLLRGKVGFSFKTAASAVKFYEQGTPILSSFRRLNHPFEWSRLLKWLLAIQGDLGVKGWEKASDDLLLRKVMMTLSAAVAGLNGLALLDPFSEQLMHHIPCGTIVFYIGGYESALARLQIQEGNVRWLPSEAVACGHEVDFRFKDLETAWRSVANLADNLAAVGKGDLHLRGFVPLADGFNHMLDRLQMFVSTS